MQNEFFSHAKIILMGEYAVLNGADAICLPLKTGQKMRVDNHIEGQIAWKWLYKNEVLAHLELDADTLEVIKENQGDGLWVKELIRLIRLQIPGFLRVGGYSLVFENLFPPDWGLGSSSATIASICRFAGANPYMVNHKLMGGSGADIACAGASHWFLYRRKMPTPAIWEIPFSYAFPQNTWFVYTGHKQPTASHLKDLDQSAENVYSLSWMQANQYIYRFLAASTLPEAFKVVYDHELLIGGHIKKELIGARFPDFPGKMKSLGAWGGDFFMVLSQQPEAFVKDYFYQKGFLKVFGWNEFIETERF